MHDRGQQEVLTPIWSRAEELIGTHSGPSLTRGWPRQKCLELRRREVLHEVLEEDAEQAQQVSGGHISATPARPLQLAARQDDQSLQVVGLTIVIHCHDRRR